MTATNPQKSIVGFFFSLMDLLTVPSHIYFWSELGHNFGSEHDPGQEGDVCSPGNKRHGNFLMFPASVSGREPNNRVRLHGNNFMLSK